MKKINIKVIVVGIIFVSLALLYYYYLSNRAPAKDATDEAVSNQLVAELTTKDIDKNYPQSPKEVVKLYTKITTAYYQTKLTDEQIEKLGSQARLLFDNELKNTQTDQDFIKALKSDIASYQKAGRYISDYKIQSSADVKYTTLNNQKYASIIALYYVREHSKLTNSYTKYMLRQDDQGRWKILYWELADIDDVD